MSACLRSACVARARRRFSARKRLVNAKGSAAGSPIPPPGRPTSLARAARIRVVRSVGHQDALHLAHFVRTGMLAKRVGIAEILIPDLRCKAHEQPAGGPADAETPVPFLARVGSMSLRNEVPQPQECGRRCFESPTCCGRERCRYCRGSRRSARGCCRCCWRCRCCRGSRRSCPGCWPSCLRSPAPKSWSSSW
jgi:hypothetical protein